MADHKPLPALPTPLTTLSADARAHRNRLIRHFLAELGLGVPAIQARQDAWLSAFEGALDDLSDSINRGAWLAGIRKQRESKYRPPSQSKASQAQTPQSTLKDVGRVQSTLSASSSSSTTNAVLAQPQSRVVPSEQDPSSSSRVSDTHLLLEHLRKHVSKNVESTTPNERHYLLICLAPFGARVYFPPTEHAFEVIQANVGCTFTPAKFSLPSDAEHLETAVLYGLKEWDTSYDGTDAAYPPPRIVGGTFSFKGADSAAQHAALAQLLRISIYIHLSLLLEQHFLHNSHVHIKFPRPRYTFPSSSSPSPSNRRPGEIGENDQGEEGEEREGVEEGEASPSASSRTHHHRHPFLPSGIIGGGAGSGGGILKSFFFSRKKTGLSHRARTVNQTGSRGGSLDLISNRASTPPLAAGGGSGGSGTGGGPISQEALNDSPGTGTGIGVGVSRLRRFSFMGVVGGGSGTSATTNTTNAGASINGAGAGAGAGSEHDRHPSFRRRPNTSPTHPESPTPTSASQPRTTTTPQGPFTTALTRLTQSKNLLSTSPGVTFFPPPILVDLAAKEVKLPTRRLRGEEKAALGSILGWTGVGTSAGSGVGAVGAGKDVFNGPGRGMSGIPGFVRMQSGTWLVSEHVPSPSPPPLALVGGVSATTIVQQQGGPGPPPPVQISTPLPVPSTPLPLSAGTPISGPGQVQALGRDHNDATPTNSTLTSPTSTNLNSNSSSSTYNTGPAPSSGSGEPPTPAPTSCAPCPGTLSTTICCGRPQLSTYRYFDFNHYSQQQQQQPANGGRQSTDQRLGELILDKLSRASLSCPTPGCALKQGEHETRIVHAGFRITITTTSTTSTPVVSPKDIDESSPPANENNKNDKNEEEKVIEMWESCRICEAKTTKGPMNDGTYLFSYAKFLELLIYSSSICVLSPALCEHTTPSPPPPLTLAPSPPPLGVVTTTPQHQHQQQQVNVLPESRLNIMRHFSIRNTGTTVPSAATVSFSVSSIDDIFELRVPRLQIHGSSEDDEREHAGVGFSSVEGNSNTAAAAAVAEKDKYANASVEIDGFGEDKKILRREVKKWWEGVADHIDKLERLLASLDNASDASSIKRLPRLPSVDDAYADFGLEESESGAEGGEDGNGDASTNERLRTPRAVFVKELPPLGPPPNTPERRFASGDEEKEEEDEVAKTPTTRSRITDVVPAPVRSDGIDESRSPLIFAAASEDSRGSTSTTSSLAAPTPSLPTTSSRLSISSTASSVSTSRAASPTPTPSIPTSTTTDDRDPRELLENLRQTFQRAEHDLYAHLARTSEVSLNDVRREFHSAAKGAQKRLAAWQKKHLVGIAKELKNNGKNGGGAVMDAGLLRELGVKDLKELVSEVKDARTTLMKCEEPEWWIKGCHAVPGSSVIVRENDWGSSIAFTLSSPDYHRELANLAVNRATVSSPPLTPPIVGGTTSSLRTGSAGPSSFFTATTGKLFGSSNSDQPDPDRNDVVWHEPEAYSAVISRKEHPRDPTSLLSIREVLRHKALPADGAGTPPTRLGALDSPQVSLASVYAKPDVGVSMEAAGGQVTLSIGTGEETMESQGAGKILHELGGRSRSDTNKSRRTSAVFPGRAEEAEGLESSSGSDAQPSASPPLDQDQSSVATSSYVEAHIKRIDAGSLLSIVNGGISLKAEDRTPTPPPKDTKGKGKEGFEYDMRSPAVKSLPATPDDPKTHPATGSSFAHTITNTLSMAMRIVLNQSDPSTPKPPPSPNPPPLPKKQQHHNLLLADLNNIDERPHIKYDWTIGKRLKFSCTVYYARQFDLMRKRCGIDDSFLKSLERSISWSAEGGKSKSNFRKTLDERFVIKTLVNAWNVADLQVLIELAPSYFRYIESTASRASVLAKLIGFYTVEIRNLETGTVQSKADLLVMENLFYKRKINRMFDLKGIQGRKVKAKAQGSKTLFDSEWIEGQQRALVLLRPHSKTVLKEAIRSDADFLAKSNIMDYSLLLGIDEDKKLIACGLVDTIGSYTFAKTLEYKAKHNLQSGKNVTVIPPAEYQERFIHALDDYFVACPDKWSKPLDESRVSTDPFLLPSVF